MFWVLCLGGIFFEIFMRSKVALCSGFSFWLFLLLFVDCLVDEEDEDGVKKQWGVRKVGGQVSNLVSNGIHDAANGRHDVPH